METDPYSYLITQFSVLDIMYYPLTIGALLGVIFILLLLVCSALVSGSEVAFFSLSPSDLNRLEEKKSKKYKQTLHLIEMPEKLLATILISNNLINVGIIIISTHVLNSLFDFSEARIIGFVLQVLIVTFLLLLFGEILPKVYANRYSLAFSLFMTRPLRVLYKSFKPLVVFMVKMTDLVKKYRKQKKPDLSIDDLSHALELTSQTVMEDNELLRGIVKFGEIDVKEIMRSRMDIFAIESATRFSRLLNIISESGYSRIPVFDESLDKIKGILYIKDLLPHVGKQNDFNWSNLLREPYYVPENKKINDLLKEFQVKKIHMAIVIDEYGGTSGIVTMEDILEEIVGEITDESDEVEEVVYVQENENTFLFEGKILLHDFYKITGIDDKVFEEVKGDADTLAGLILELKGEIPVKNSVISYKNFTFTINSADKRRIKQIRVKLESENNKEQSDS